MERNNHVPGWLLRIATGTSLLLLTATVVLWITSSVNTHNGSPVTILRTWGDRSVAGERTILLGFDNIFLDMSWAERPLPAGAAQGQTVYDYDSDFLGFRFYQSYYRPLDGEGRPLPGIFGRSRGFAIPFGAFSLISLILPLRALVILILRRATLARERAARGLCPHCGYDLRATPGRCPECGMRTLVARVHQT